MSSFNKITKIEHYSKIQEQEIEKIPIIDIRTTMNHTKKGIRSYTLIDNICITNNANNIIEEAFNFDVLTEKDIPFIKFIPKINTFNNAKIGFSGRYTFIPNWLQINDKYVLLVGIYARELNEDDNDIQLFVSLDIIIRNIPYVNQIYLAKS